MFPAAGGRPIRRVRPGVPRRLRVAGTLGVAGLALGSAWLPAQAAPSPTPSPWPLCPVTALPFGVPSSPVTPTPMPAPVSSSGGDLAGTGLRADLPPGTAEPALFRVSAWLVADTATGAVLAACNAHVPLAPASTLKLLTALALIDAVPFTARYTASSEQAAVDGTRVGLVPGLGYSGSDLWHGLLMSSGNDCAYALAELAGGQGVAAARLNATARRLGAADTHAVNTSGLDAPGQTSSAFDLALIGRAALDDDRIRSLAQTRSYPFPGGAVTPSGGSTGPRTVFQIQNHDRLLGGYPGATGLKNGWTSAAGGSLVATATRGDRSYLAVVMRVDGSVWQAAAALLDWAFATGGVARPVGTLDVPPLPAVPSAASGTPGTPSASSTPAASGSAGVTTSGSATDGTAGPTAGSTVASGVAGDPASRGSAGAAPGTGGVSTGWVAVLLLAGTAGGLVARHVSGARRATEAATEAETEAGTPAGTEAGTGPSGG